MDETHQPLFEAVRRACSPRTWSRGVELTRADAVVGERIETDEAVFRVATRGGMISPKVTLFPDDAEWDCECPSREEACEHVAASVIAWKRAREEGASMPESRSIAARVGYRFRSEPQGLALERVIVHGDDEQPMPATIAAHADGKVPGPRILAAKPDLVAEVALGTHRRGLIPAAHAARILEALCHCEDLRLDGKPVRIGREALLPRVVLEDQGGGFRLAFERDPTVSRTYGNGIALCGGELRRRGDPRLTAREREELLRGRHFTPDQLAELVTEVLPGLQSRLELVIRTERLPQTSRERPRASIDLQREGDVLTVLPTLVYGDPPRARVDAGRLVHLAGSVPLRDLAGEAREIRRLAELGLKPGSRVEFQGEQAVGFVARLARWGGVVADATAGCFALAPPLVPRLTVTANGFDLAFEAGSTAAAAGSAARSADAGAVLRAWSQGASLVPLLAGGWAPLPADWLGRLGPLVVDLMAARDDAGQVPPCCLPDLADLCEALDQPPPPALDRLRALVERDDPFPAAVLPGDLVTELRPYQQQGVDWLVGLRDAGLGALLADDMGLGKTLQALCAIRGRTLVVAPTSVLHNWADEALRHRGLTAQVYHGPARALDPDAALTITTYALLRLDADRLAAESWDTVVLDEAQNIKNPQSQVATAAYRLDARFRLALTGTPVENRLDELWSQFHFVNRGLLGGRSDFKRNYDDPIAGGDDEAVTRLRRRIRPFILRRLKTEVARELPPRTEMVLHCELSPDERETYDAIRAASMQEVVRRLATGGNVLAALEALLRLRQAACHSGLIPGREAENSSKLELLLECLDSIVAEGRRALVFSQWTSLLDRVEPHLKRRSFEFLRLDGATRERGEVVKRFQAEDGPPILLISLKAGGTGLNLTAADHIFLLDPWWNPAVEDQAADRAHRIGQERPVMVYRLVARDTVEERVLALQQRKRGLAEAALGQGSATGALTREDLLDLLR